jgi:hypothetical protein
MLLISAFLFLNVAVGYEVKVLPDPNGDSRVDDRTGNGEGDYIDATKTVLAAGDYENAADTSNFLLRAVFSFRLPTLVANESITSATLNIYRRTTSHNTPSYNCALYHLRDINRIEIEMSDYGTSASLVDPNFAIPTGPTETYCTVDIKDEILSDYENDTNSTYAVFRIQEDGLAFPSGGNGDSATERYEFNSTEASDNWPVLILNIQSTTYTGDDEINPDPNGDARVDDRSGDSNATYIDSDNNYLKVGDYENALDTANFLLRGVLIFKLPSLSSNQSIDEATLSIYRGDNVYNTPQYNCALYHLPNVNRADVQLSDYNASETVIASNFALPDGTVDTYYTQNVLSFIHTDYENDSNSDDTYAAFRLQEDGLLFPSGNDGNDASEQYVFNSVNSSTNKPKLELSIITEVNTVTVNPPSLGDARVDDRNDDGVGDYIDATNTVVLVGDYENAADTSNFLIRNALVFELPSLSEDEFILKAFLRIYRRSSTSGHTPTLNCALYHLVDLNRAYIEDEDYGFSGELVNTHFSSPNDVINRYYEEDVTSAVRLDYSSDTGASKYSAFRLQEDGLLFPSGSDGDSESERYTFYTSDYTSYKPELILQIAKVNKWVSP